MRSSDNTKWSAGRAGETCLQMKNVNFRRAAQKTEEPAGELQKERARGLRKREGQAPEKSSSLARPFPQPSLMCSPSARLSVQPTGPSCSAAYRPALLCGRLEMSQAENFCPLPAPCQKFLSSVHTTSAFVVHFPVCDCTAPHHPTLFVF